MTEFVSESDNAIAVALDPFFQELKAKAGILFAAHLIGGINEMVETRIKLEREQAVRECAEVAGTQRGETADGQYTWWEVSNNIRNRILSLSQVSAKK